MRFSPDPPHPTTVGRAELPRFRETAQPRTQARTTEGVQNRDLQPHFLHLVHDSRKKLPLISQSTKVRGSAQPLMAWGTWPGDSLSPFFLPAYRDAGLLQALLVVCLRMPWL